MKCDSMLKTSSLCFNCVERASCMESARLVRRVVNICQCAEKIFVVIPIVSSFGLCMCVCLCVCEREYFLFGSLCMIVRAQITWIYIQACISRFFMCFCRCGTMFGHYSASAHKPFEFKAQRIHVQISNWKTFISILLRINDLYVCMWQLGFGAIKHQARRMESWIAWWKSDAQRMRLLFQFLQCIHSFIWESKCRNLNVTDSITNRDVNGVGVGVGVVCCFSMPRTRLSLKCFEKVGTSVYT